MKKLLRWSILPILLFILNGCANGVFYQPSTAWGPTPDERGLVYENIEFRSADQVKLTAWWLPSTQAEVKGVVVHFHGNAHNMSGHVGFVEWMTGEGYHVFVFDYRGYGKSEGKPNRKGLVRDGVAALNYVDHRRETEKLPLFVWGQSLGGTVALQSMVNSKVEVAAALIDSTFYSHARIASDKIKELPWFFQILRPFRPLLIRGGWDANDAVKELKDVPLAFLHGEADRVIPVGHSRMLHPLAVEGTPLWTIPGARHCMAALSMPDLVRPLILGFFEANTHPQLDSESPESRK
jgi:fermentation-respiration switch protein FrsA (DUF1100 family)